MEPLPVYMYVNMSVCLSVCHTNQIIRLEDEKVNLIENSILRNNWFFDELY